MAIINIIFPRSIWTISTLIMITSAWTHNCSDPAVLAGAPCANHNVYCKDNETCSIFCNGVQECKSSIIYCTDGQSCQITCGHYESCDSMQVYCPANGECIIDCSSEIEQACEGINITAGSDGITNVDCRGEEACMSATIDCKDSAQCDIHCYGLKACGDHPPFLPMTIYGQDTQNLSLSGCNGGTLDTPPCNGLNIYCPSYDANESPRCYLPGGGQFSVLESPHGTPLVVSGGVNIFAKHSWRDIVIVGYDATAPISGSMTCEDGEYECVISSSETEAAWDCTDTNILCSRGRYTTDPTVEPTSNPTNIPTVNPTTEPTTNPTSDPTTSPTRDPTTNPTVDPTTNPTTEPTEPTLNPTGSPTTEPTLDPTASPSVFVAESTEHGFFSEHARWGLFIGMLLVVVFVCLLFCGWRWWNKGDSSMDGSSGFSPRGKHKTNDKTQSLAQDDSDEEDDGEDVNHHEREAGGDGVERETKRKKKKKKKKGKKKEGGDGHAVEIEVDARKEENEDGGQSEEVKKKKKKKKKKKRKKTKENEDETAGDYQKQTDDPFETNQWTELTEFD